MSSEQRAERPAEPSRDAHPGSAASDRVAMALEAGHLGTWRWDVATGQLEWDAPLQRVFGLESPTFPGTFEAYIELLHPDDRADSLAAIEQSMSTGRPHYVEHRIFLRDGRSAGSVAQDAS